MADKEKPSKPTRKRLVGLKRERLYNRAILAATAVVVLLVVGMVAWGLIKENLIDPRVVVAVVEGEEITGREFQSRARVNRQQLISTYMQHLQSYQLFATNPGLQQQVLSQMSQVQFQLLPSTVGLDTINQLVDDRLIILEAQKLGIEISEAQVDKELESIFGYFPDGAPTPSPLPTQIPTSTLSSTQLAIVTITPTPSPIPTRTPAPEEEVESTATPANTPAAASPTPTLALTATAYTFDAYQQDLQDYAEIQESELGFTADDLRVLVRTNLYRQALFDLLTADIPAEEEQVWARHILVEDEESAIEILAQLEAGADWAELAAEHSLDTNNSLNGGDLGWFRKADMVEPFADTAFELEIGEISEPVESSFGWHIIQALGRELRPLSPQQYAQVRNDIFQAYIRELRNDYEWEIFDTWFALTPEDPKIPAQYRLQ